MPRDIPVGNGNILVAFDKYYLLRDFYFPFVGQENHTAGHAFRLGFWVNGKFAWLGEGWDITLKYLDETMVTDVELVNRQMGIRVLANDLVDFRENIYLKKMTLENLADHPAEVRIFFYHDFHIFGTEFGNTANIRPDTRALFHFKEKRCFLINVSVHGKQGFWQFTIGNKESPQQEGAWRDAEDGVLGNNPVAEGTVDSVGAVQLFLEPRARDSFFYWIAAGTDWNETTRLNNLAMSEAPDTIFKRTADYWKLWAGKETLNCEPLPGKISWLYKRSLLITRTQVDNRGGILAANDPDSLWFNRDTYGYIRMRDGAMTAYGLDLAGYSGITQPFYDFCARVIHHEGYFLHTYTPTGAEGGGWHTWFDPEHNEAQLPIQEDETALVLWALWNHYHKYRDIEFIRPLYGPLIKNAGNFLLNYRDKKTGLPLPSYDPWGERRGLLTYTISVVYAGLEAAANFTEAFGETGVAVTYRKAAAEIREGMERYLYLHDEKRFARMINFRRDGSVDRDTGVDASLFAVFAFGAFPVDDHRVTSTMEQLYDKLWCKIGVGGMARYAGDDYRRVTRHVPGNPWIVTTLWLAMYHIARAASRQELGRALELIQWVADRALPSGVLAEQVNPLTGEPMSASPLTWSHSTFIAVVHLYLERLAEIERCELICEPQLS
jgi:GH15 family glucan-1,4-alpha-glucosidase